MDLEAVGGAATGGLIAGAIEKPGGRAGEHHAECPDCGTETLGRFCHNCGNPTHVHRTLLHLGEELLHGVMHFDSRTWRSLPLLLFRPGRLTREWIEGKRARYVSPLAMFLFTVFVLFMALSYLPGPSMHEEPKTFAEARTEAVARVTRAEEKLAKAEAKLKAATPEGQAEAQEAVTGRREGLKKAQDDVATMDRLAALGVTDLNWKPVLEAEKGHVSGINTGNAKLDAKISAKLANPELAFYKFEQTFYKFSFLLIPISIPFVALLFLWKRGFTLYDHGVFVLYSLTFVSLLIMISAMAIRFGDALGGYAVLATFLIVPVHMFFQLKGAYGLGTFSALWRTFVLLNFASIALTLFILAVLYLGLA